MLGNGAALPVMGIIAGFAALAAVWESTTQA